MPDEVRKVTYLVNTRHSLNLQFGGQDYKIPSGETTIPALAAKLDVSEEQALKVAKHAASVYSTFRHPTKPSERSAPPQTWVRLETRVESDPEPPEAVVEAPWGRVGVFQDVEADESNSLQ